MLLNGTTGVMTLIDACIFLHKCINVCMEVILSTQSCLLLCLWILAGEYQQYDMFVYPAVTKVPKGILGQIKDKGRGLVNMLLGSRTPSEGATDVEMKTLNREDMAKRCLHFYLDSYMFNEEQWTNFQMDGYVRQIGTLFLRHYKPSVKHYHPSEEPIYVIVKVSYLYALLHSSMNIVYNAVSMFRK